ncbi:MAG: RluA family pseudouridine synthase [Patescibacteria group bacterium]|nr:RluA family pseudouridine synthase [Patescibacteria group bacterium]
MSKYFEIIFEDDDLLVINKPSGLVVESDKKDARSSVSTLEKILINEYKINLPRGGIVHRLDRDTSGLMVVAKNEKALVNLQNQFASHQVKKIYEALVFGKLEPKKGTINIALKRDPKNRTRFVSCRGVIHNALGREAITHYEVKKYLHSSHMPDLSYIDVIIETGRTHQIRAHFFAIGFPVVGDPVYKSRDSEIFSKKIGLRRQFLHASELSFKHPKTGEMLDFKSKLPSDLKMLLE